MIVVGVDCATQNHNIGLACGAFGRGGMTVHSVTSGALDPVGVIADWLADHSPALLALDAPLGWPRDLAQALVGHRAGDPLEAAEPFNRATDRVIHREVGRKPLDVGADRIARTAVAALDLLEEVRQRTGCAIPLAWDSAVEALAAIEVYPAGTLRAHGLRHAGYKRTEQVDERAEILEALEERMVFGPGVVEEPLTDDALDALVCLLAAQDFLAGDVIQPTDPEHARKEGWIWVKLPS